MATRLGHIRVERHHDVETTPLVFLHGLGSAASTFHPIAEHLPDRHIIAPDLLGFGGSSRPDAFDYSMAGQAAMISEVLRHLEVERCDLVGHSMGGTVALALAALFPPLVRRLVAAEPNLSASGGPASLRATKFSEDDYAVQGLHQIFRDFRPGPGASPSAVHYWNTLGQTDPRAMHRASLRLVELDGLDAMALIEAARGLIAGADSGDRSLEEARSLGVRVEVVPRAGHDMFMDNPSDTARA